MYLSQCGRCARVAALLGTSSVACKGLTTVQGLSKCVVIFHLYICRPTLCLKKFLFQGTQPEHKPPGRGQNHRAEFPSYCFCFGVPSHIGQRSGCSARLTDLVLVFLSACISHFIPTSTLCCHPTFPRRTRLLHSIASVPLFTWFPPVVL